MRREFSNKTKLEAWNRCGGKCEGMVDDKRCGLPLGGVNRPEYDHIVECWEGGDNSLENCQVLGAKCCHKPKSKEKAGERAKVDRLRLKHLGIIRPKGTIKSRPFNRSQNSDQ